MNMLTDTQWKQVIEIVGNEYAVIPNENYIKHLEDIRTLQQQNSELRDELSNATEANRIVAELNDRLNQQNKQLIEALEEAEAEMDQWRDAGHAMACVKVIVNRALQSIKGES
jgi:predicted  nucleic acid-binding Zn-ribbon protein